MSDKTTLDLAHAAIATGEGEVAHRLFFAVLLAQSLIVPLEREPTGDVIAPITFDISGGQVCLAFDTEARLASFMPEGVPYASLSGRQLFPLLALNGLGLGVNLDVAPSSTLLAADTLSWIAARLEGALTIPITNPQDLVPAGPVDKAKGQVLETCLTLLDELASGAGVASLGDGGLTLVIYGVEEGAVPTCQIALSDMFSLIDDQPVALCFLAEIDDDLTPPEVLVRPRVQQAEPAPAPSANPDRPPRLI